MLNKLIYLLPLLIMAMLTTTMTTTIPIAAQRADCSEPTYYDESHVIQDCGDGKNLINIETGEETFIRDGENKTLCDENGQCFQLSS